MTTDLRFLRRLHLPKRRLSPEAASFILDIGFADEDIERMNELAAKAQEGTLSGKEWEESLNYDIVGHLIAILHSRARRSLPKTATPK
ncbi:MAG: hypothetical protein U0793_20365 [Gemmataceae bacterium]